MAITLAAQKGGLPYTDHSGTIAAASVSQSALSENAGRGYLFMQNNGASDLWANLEGGAAAAASPSIRIPAGSWYEPPRPPTGAIAVFSTQLGLSFTIKEA